MAAHKKLYERLKDAYCKHLKQPRFLDFNERALAAETFYFSLGNHAQKHLLEKELRYRSGVLFCRLMDAKHIETGKRSVKGAIKLRANEFHRITEHERNTVEEIRQGGLASIQHFTPPQVHQMSQDYDNLAALHLKPWPPLLYKQYPQALRKFIFNYAIAPMIKPRSLPEIRRAFEQFEEEHEELERKEFERRGN